MYVASFKEWTSDQHARVVAFRPVVELVEHVVHDHPGLRYRLAHVTQTLVRKSVPQHCVVVVDCAEVDCSDATVRYTAY